MASDFQTCFARLATLVSHILTYRLIAVSLLFVIFSSLVLLIFRLKDDPREPPRAKGTFKAFLRHGLHAFDVLAAQNLHKFPDGIFTVSLFGFHVYVVNDPEVITTVSARSRHTSFKPTMIRTTATLAGHKGNARKLMFKNIDEPEVGRVDGWFQDMHKLVLKTLAPGPVLEDLILAFLPSYDSHITLLHRKVFNSPNLIHIDLYQWICEAMTTSISDAVWGPSNPYSVYPDLWQKFWIFNDSFNFFTYNIWPQLLARRGVAARKEIASAFAKYQESKAFKKASPLGKDRIELLKKLGLSNTETARMAVPATVGQAGNTIPTTFASLSYILRDPSLVSSIRKELDGLLVYKDPTHVSFDAFQVRALCPLLVSSVYETMRIISLANTFRSVMEDFSLSIPSSSTTYLLKKGGMIWSSGSTIHRTTDFHHDADKFVPNRFLGMSNPETQMPGLFRGFGGGASICSGRHFATAIVMASIGSLLVRFDFERVNELYLPRRDDLVWGHAMPKPKGKTWVDMKLRKGFESVVWERSLMPSVMD
ncbi:MAG: hypothetical protein Q9160_004399 [Pyrenula sp. 1 TL-2023]